MNLHIHIEKYFEKVVDFATFLLGNSIVFIMALCMVLFWFSNRSFQTQFTQEIIRDFIHGITFLSLFIIQKSFNRFSGALHLKVNELVVSNKVASNTIINAETKTEHDMTELTKEYTKLAEKAAAEEEEKAS